MKKYFKKIMLSIYIILCFFFTGWASCMIMIESKHHSPITNHMILGIFSLIWGIAGLYKLVKSY